MTRSCIAQSSNRVGKVPRPASPVPLLFSRPRLVLKLRGLLTHFLSLHVCGPIAGIRGPIAGIRGPIVSASMVRKRWRSYCEHIRTALDAASEVSCMLVAVMLPVHHASVALQVRQCCGRASQWSKGEEVAVMLPVHHASSALRRGNTPGGHPSG
jgi:hypothetical protein